MGEVMMGGVRRAILDRWFELGGGRFEGCGVAEGMSGIPWAGREKWLE